MCIPVGARSSGTRQRAVSGKIVQARAGVANPFASLTPRRCSLAPFCSGGGDGVDVPKFTKRKTRKWRQPETVAGPNVSLAIDKEIKKLIKDMKLQARWSIDDPLAFGRLAMRIALEDAHYHEGRKASDQFKYWKAVEASALKAEVALGRLLGQIGEGLPTGIVLTVTRFPKSFVKSGRIEVRTSPRQKPNGGSFTPDDFVPRLPD